MTYKQFKQELYANILLHGEAVGKQVRILEKYAFGVDEETMRTVKIRNSILYGRSEYFIEEDMLYIAWKEWGILHMLYWRTAALYERFLREGWQGVLPEIIFKLQDSGRQGERSKSGRLERGAVWERLIIRPQNYYCCREELKNAVYWKFGDIALVLHTILYENKKDYISMRCSRDAIRYRGVPNELIMVNALLQTCVMLPPRMHYGRDIQRYLNGRNEGPIVMCREEGIRGYRLTNSKGMDGAAVLFYPKVKEQLAGMFGGDYYVGFLNIREVVIHPVRHKVLAEMKAAVQRNNAMFAEREVLTNKVYRYCDSRKKLIEV